MMVDLDNKYIIKSLKEAGINLNASYNLYTADFFINNEYFEIYIVLDDTFPYEFPKVRLKQDYFDLVRNFPHINADATICCFDSTIVFPNVNEPENIIVSLLIQAKKILNDGLLNNNNSDIFDEFLAYWEMGLKGSSFYIIDDLPKHFSLMYCYYEKDFKIIHTDIKTIKNFLSNCGFVFYQECLIKCVFIPFNSSIHFIPQNAYEMNLAIRQNSNYYGQYARYIQKNYCQKNIVIFSLPAKSPIICGFINPRIPQINGYRAGRSPLLMSLSRNKNLQIEKISVSNASQKRIFDRGGIGLNTESINICIIGCGSVGSNLAEAFASCGVNNYYLIDNDIISIDNIARHTCGFQYIGVPKTEAVRDNITKHNPNIICDVNNDNANLILEHSIDLIAYKDLIISTTANAPLEYHLLEKLNEEKIKKPIVLMWVEPYSICGHAILINKHQDIFSELYDDNMSFLESVVKNPDQYYKRESGCQSTYMPYSGLNVKMFVASFVKEFINGTFENDKNYHFIWVGDIQNHIGVEIKDKWKQLSNNSIYIERIK